MKCSACYGYKKERKERVHEIQPAAWQMSLMQPIYKGGDKSKADPASYRGIYLSSALAKLFEGILISRLTKFTETHSTLIENHVGTRSGRQVHDAIYCLLSIIQYSISQKGLATYVAFCDFSTAFPSIHRGKLGPPAGVLLPPSHYPAFPLVLMAATATSSAFRYA